MIMDAVWEYFKNNALSIVAIAISLYTLYQNHQGGKSIIKGEIAKKKAELKALNSVHHFTDGTTMSNTMIRRSVLEEEIGDLKRML